MAADRLLSASAQLNEPIAPALVAALAIHALVILAIGFGVSWPEIEKQSIAVTVLLTPSNQAPVEAQHVAAQDQLGFAEEPEPAAAQFQMQTTMTISRELDGADGELAPEEVTPPIFTQKLP